MRPTPRARHIGAAAFLALLLCGCQAAGERRPSAIVLITIDTLRADRLGVYGATVPTPHLDALARQGIWFTEARANVPLTLPSHATLLSGLHPSQHGVHNNGSFRLGAEIPVLPELLRERGWATAAVVASIILDAQFGLARGFESYDGPQTTSAQAAGIEGPERRADVVTQAAIEWIEEHGDRPYFLWVHYYDPHTPYAPPAPFASRFPGAPYDGEVAYTDHQIGRLVDSVKASRLGEKALFAVLSDHGESLGEHGEATHGVFLYDSVLKIPFILSGAGVPARGGIDAPVSGIDLVPTLLSIAGVSAPADLPGRALLAKEKKPADDISRSILAETRMPCLNFGWSRLEAIVEGNLKLVRHASIELYDLEADPSELVDLGARRAAERQRLEARLQGALASLPPAIPAPPGASAGAQLPDAETRARLESLGYIGGASPPAGGCAAGPDPRSMLGVLEVIDSGVRQFHLGRYEEAAAAFTRVIEGDPKNVQAHYYLAQALERLQRIEAAARQFAEAARLDPHNLTFRHDEAAAWFELGELERAEARLREALETIPDAPKTRFFLGNVLSARGRPQEALAMYEAARAAMPPAAELEYRRGQALLKLGRREEAIETLRLACSLAPQRSEWHGLVSGLLAGSGRMGEAVALLREFVSRHPDDYLGLYNLGRLLEASGDPAGALRAYLHAEANWGGDARHLATMRARIRQLGGAPAER